MVISQTPAIDFNPNGVPKMLTETLPYSNWRYEERDGKLTKPPINPQTQGYARVNDPSTFGSFESAVQNYNEFPNSLAGVGMLLTSDSGLVGFDFDKCRDPLTGKIDPDIHQAIIDSGLYAEVSPSGTGIHAFGLGKLPAGARRRGGFESYDTGRFLTVTGERVPGCAEEITPQQESIEQLHRRFITPPKDATTGGTGEDAVIDERTSRSVSDDGTVSYFTDADVLRMAMNAKNGEKFRRLYGGDDLGKSPSEGDAAFFMSLAFYTRDPEQIERIARDSPRARDKWDGRRGDTTWVERDIANALAAVTNHYDPNYGSGASDYNPDIIAAWERPTASRRRFVLEQPRDLFNRPRPRWVIDGVFVEDSLALGAAPPSSFKSFIGLDCALSVATGKDWHGREVQQAPVVYINAEGNGKVLDRISAWSIANDIDLSGDVPIYFIGTAPQLLDQGDVSDLLASIAELPTPPGFIVIDTVARSLVGGEENSAKDMGLFVAGMDALRKTTGAAVFAIHHVNKATGEARGSTALTGAMDTIIRLDRNGPTVALTCTKQKDAEEFKPIHLAARRIEIDEDRESLVFDEVARADSPGKPVTNATQMKAIEELLLRPGVGHNVWRDACREKAGIPFSTFKLAKDALKTQGLVKQEGERGPYTVTDLGRSFMLANGVGPA